MSKQLTFKVMSGLKDIIGRDLITDDFVAVFELVKNAYDAHAKNVEVRFEDLDSDSARLIIKDDGKGMSSRDIDEKWLAVAYSAKKEGDEDDTKDRPQDYRDKITQSWAFAGSKGIGRFSCDRLGRSLDLYTRVGVDERFEHVSVDWEKFEADSKEEFDTINVERTKVSQIPYNVRTGTVLVISNLHANWDRPRLKQLRDSLRKLINPNEGNEARKFSIKLEVPTEKEADREEKLDRDKVNGKIENFIFEQLGLKTTEIRCDIDEKGERLITTLNDRETLIYRLVEKNPFDYLKNLKIHVFALNMAAKRHFHKVMGVHNVEYGSVFLYKNGFRIQGIGDEGDDPFGIDRRKQQGQARHIGTRDLTGRIEITAGNNIFKEVSSRDAGIIDSPEWHQLTDLFSDIVLKRLEKYAIDVIKWGNPPKGSEEEIRPQDKKAQILELINKLTGSEGVLDIQYDKNLLSIISERQSQSVATALTNFKRIAALEGNDSLRRDISRAEKRFIELATAKEEAEAEASEERKTRSFTEKQLETERRKNIFLVASSKDPTHQKDSLDHWIKISAQKMGGTIDSLIHDIKQDKFDKTKLLTALSKLQFWISQAVKVSSIVTKADFNLKVEEIRKDLSRFIFEYLNSDEVYYGRIRLNMIYDNEPFIVRFRPIEVAILFDNLINNALKAHARNVEVDLRRVANELRLTIANDGEAVPKSIMQSLFELGISGRGGSGIGLHTVREIVTGMNGEIEFAGNDSKLGGASFKIIFRS